MQAFTFLTIILFGTACNGPVKKDLAQKREHSQLIKSIDAPQSIDLRYSLQDKEGNLWFGTSNGLYKYDGKLFIQFTVTNGLISNDVSCLLEDKDGNIWVGTHLGLCLYDGKTFTQIQIPLPKNLPPNKNPNYQNHWVYSMIQAKSGKLWFATIDGVYIYDGKSFTYFPIDEAPNGFLTSNDKVERILEDKAGNIWFGGRTNEGVFRYDGKSITHIKLPELIQRENQYQPTPHSWGWPQLQDKNGNIWFSNWGGAYRYDGKTITSFSSKDGLTSIVTKIIQDRKGNLWFGCDGLRHFDGKTFTRVTTKDGLTSFGGWSFLEDSSGNIWVGTKENGFCIFNGKEFITYSEFKQTLTD